MELFEIFELEQISKEINGQRKLNESESFALGFQVGRFTDYLISNQKYHPHNSK